MEFLVDIAVHLPADLPPAEVDRLMAAERIRGRELLERGAIRQIWRIPGSVRNVSVWNAEDATVLHALLMSLPSFRFTEIAVTPLAEHPLRGGPDG